MKAIDKIGSAFLRRILRRMKELGVSQTELARRMNVSRPYVTKVLSRDVNFSFKTAAKLANALKMDFFPDLREQDTSSEPDSHHTGRGASHPSSDIASQCSLRSGDMRCPPRPPNFSPSPVTTELRKMV